MGFLSPKAPQIQKEVTPEPDPLEERPETITDPEALEQARRRADEAKRRQDRRKLRIPLNISVGGTGSGLTIA